MSLTKSTNFGVFGVLTRLLLLVYSALLTVVIAALALRSAVSILRLPKHREGLGERFGRVRPDLAAVVAGKRVVWVHAVSVGEVLASSPLVKELSDTLGDGWVIVVSTITPTGQALAKQRFGPGHVFYTPIDFGFSVRAYLDALRPATIVLIESGVWPRMTHECEKRGIPVIVANARVGDKSFKRALKMRGLWSRVLRRATLWLAQSEGDATRLMEMGVPAELVKVCGNLKYDICAPKESRVADLIREAAAGRPILVAGSTVSDDTKDEEVVVLAAWFKAYILKTPSLLVLAPRHPERFSKYRAYADRFGCLSASDWLAADKPIPLPTKSGDMQSLINNNGISIVLLDTIGDLAASYQLADVAIVGGSFVKKGGHNPLEPAQFGVPIAMGVSYENFKDIVTKLRSANAISIVNDEEDLCNELAKLLHNREYSRAMGKRGRKVFEEQQGATKCMVEVIIAMTKR